MNDRTNNGETALHFASSYQIAKALVEAGADIDAVTSVEAGCSTVLMCAVYAKNLAYVQLIVDRHVKLNEQNTQGETALGIAVECHLTKIARLLRKHHAVVKLGW